MKICTTHWAALRKAIDDKGMAHLVAKSGQELSERLKMQIAGVDKPFDYDPLMDSNMMIFEQFMRIAGPAASMGDVCPLCEVKKHGGGVPGLAADWIEGSTNAALTVCQQHGLLPKKVICDVCGSTDLTGKIDGQPCWRCGQLWLEANLERKGSDNAPRAG